MLGRAARFAIVSPENVKRLGAPLESIRLIIDGETTPSWQWNAALDVNISKPSIPAVLDSGVPFTQIPSTAHNTLIKKLKKLYPNMLDMHVPRTPWLGEMSCEFASLHAAGQSIWSVFAVRTDSHASSFQVRSGQRKH